MRKRALPPPPRSSKPLAPAAPAPRKAAAPPPPAVDKAIGKYYKPNYKSQVTETLNLRTDPNLKMLGTYAPYHPVVYDVLDSVGLDEQRKKLQSVVDQYMKPTVMVRDPDDLETIRHELAHAMDDYHNITTSRYGTPGTTAVPSNAGPRMGALRENPFLFQILMRQPQVAQEFPGMLGTPPMDVPDWGPWGDRHELYAYMAQRLPMSDPNQGMAWAAPYFPFYNQRAFSQQPVAGQQPHPPMDQRTPGGFHSEMDWYWNAQRGMYDFGPRTYNDQAVNNLGPYPPPPGWYWDRVRMEDDTPGVFRWQLRRSGAR